jgi:hypothetical protein
VHLVGTINKKRRYWKLKEEALDRTLWRTRFGRGYGPVVRQTAEWMKRRWVVNLTPPAALAPGSAPSSYWIRDYVGLQGRSRLFLCKYFLKLFHGEKEWKSRDDTVGLQLKTSTDGKGGVNDLPITFNRLAGQNRDRRRYKQEDKVQICRYVDRRTAMQVSRRPQRHTGSWDGCAAVCIWQKTLISCCIHLETTADFLLHTSENYSWFPAVYIWKL